MSLRVLLVDDDPDIRFIGEMALARVGGFTVSLAESGNACLTLAKEGPDVILLDVMMPGMDGTETLARLRDDAELASIPVIFMTAKVQHAEVERYRELGAVGVIAKPFDPMNLATRVAGLLEG
ncbi:MAG: response regulator [Deltaproteobacteria bacterium]|nr:response regulator [Deltaproteobacteria bacterium]